MLSCAAARAFACSLLDRRPNGRWRWRHSHPGGRFAGASSCRFRVRRAVLFLCGLVRTRVCSSFFYPMCAKKKKFASQFAVQDDSGARNHGGVPVFADDFSQPRLKRLRLVSRGAPVQSELHADCGPRVEPVPSRRVVLVPGSPDDTPRSIQDRSCAASNRFSVLAESDAEDGQPQHHDIGTPPPTADEGDIENNDTASLVGQLGGTTKTGHRSKLRQCPSPTPRV